MWEHTLLTFYLVICLSLIILSICSPNWAVSTETNQFYITSGITIYVGFWEQCEEGYHSTISRHCRLYQISQTSLPTYFNYTRWVCCLNAVLVAISIVFSILSNPRLGRNTFNPCQKLAFRLTTVSICIFSGSFVISGAAWFTYMCYSNQLGSLVGPGSIQSLRGNFSFYTPAWSAVVMIMAGCCLIVGGFVHLGRAICIYKAKISETPEQDLQMINEVMRWHLQPEKMIELDNIKKQKGDKETDSGVGSDLEAITPYYV